MDLRGRRFRLYSDVLALLANPSARTRGNGHLAHERAPCGGRPTAFRVPSGLDVLERDQPPLDPDAVRIAREQAALDPVDGALELPRRPRDDSRGERRALPQVVLTHFGDTC